MQSVGFSKTHGASVDLTSEQCVGGERQKPEREGEQIVDTSSQVELERCRRESIGPVMQGKLYWILRLRFILVYLTVLTITPVSQTGMSRAGIQPIINSHLSPWPWWTGLGGFCHFLSDAQQLGQEAMPAKPSAT